MTKFLFFLGFSSIVYWLINGDIDFYKISISVLFILLGLFKDMTDFWKYEATRDLIISVEMLRNIDTLYGEGASDKLLSLAKKTTLKQLKELEESGKEIPDSIYNELERLKTELEKENNS